MQARRIMILALLLAGAGVASVPATVAAAATRGVQQSVAPAGSFEDLLPVDDFSPAVLGIYRKLMEIEDEIRQSTERYGVDYELARAVCMYESGGNANLTSWAGAKGYFQVMPATFRSLGVATNIEAGIKYLGQLVRRFEREDYALAAYNGGPTNVGRGRAMRLESLQYVLGVGNYRSVLKQHEKSLRYHASQLLLTTVLEDEDWWGVSRRLGLSLLQLRMHNPYLAPRQLRAGQLVAYPASPRDGLFEQDEGFLRYRSRIGDNYFNIAFTLETELDELRAENGLWHLQTLPAGLWLRVPLAWEGEHTLHRVEPGETVATIAESQGSEPWRIIRDNGLFWSDAVAEGAILRIRKVPPPPKFVVHRVAQGENLTTIARRYGTTIASIQNANGMGSRTVIRIGEQLRIPAVAE